ncbi:MAG: sigma-70 family RNA polymerase sigma factor [Bacteroidetes bacterium]|nr:sigma-70 family RNA polymerase sigma factor [Bacteroidota bacterium]
MGKYSDLTDFQLIQKISKYDSRALEELYDRYSQLLYTIIKKIAPDEQTADNVLVEVFAIVWKKASDIDFTNSSVYTWIVSLARNRIVYELRRSRAMIKDTSGYNDAFEDFFIIPQLDKKIDNLDLDTAMNIKPKMENALSKLSDTQKYVIHLAYYEGFTLDEISDKLGIPVETVRGKIMAALHTLKDNLISE